MDELGSDDIEVDEEAGDGGLGETGEAPDLFSGLDFECLDEAEPDVGGFVEGEGEGTEIDEVGALGEAIDGVNPNFDPFDIESPYSNNCGSCALAVEGRLDGDPFAVASAENVGTVAEMEAITGKEQVSLSPSEIERTLLEQGPGAHAIVGVDRLWGPGHWFNAVVSADGTTVYALDGQTGEVRGWPPDYGNVVHWDMSMKKES